MIKLRALTLVELLITVSIFAIITVIAVPLIAQNRGEISVEGDAGLVKEFIIKAKAFAQNPENEAATAYRVEKITPAQMEIKRVVKDRAESFGEYLTLSQSSVSDFQPITFDVPSGEINDISLSHIIYIMSLNGGSQKTVWVEYPGVVHGD